MRRSLIIGLIAALHIGAFLCFEAIHNGDIVGKNGIHSVYPLLEMFSSAWTDLKFKVRGSTARKNKIVIVGIDELSLKKLGRWPWPRDQMDLLLLEIFKHKPLVVGLDMVFSEPEHLLPEELIEEIKKTHLKSKISEYDSDARLAETIRKYREELVLGWVTNNPSIPGINDDGFAYDERFTIQLPADLSRFTYGNYDQPKSFDMSKAKLWRAITVTSNLPAFNKAAKHSGFFNVQSSADGDVRRAFTTIFAGDVPYPSLPLEIARTGLKDHLRLKVGPRGKIETVDFVDNPRGLTVNRMGLLEINYRGPEDTFPHVSAVELLSPEDTLEDLIRRKVVGQKKSELLEGAYVIVGVTANAVGDYRSTPVDPILPGVEGQANILDNILTGDPLIPSSATNDKWILALAMAFIAFFIAQVLRRLEAIRGVFALSLISALLLYLDFGVLFAANKDWHSAFFWLEWTVLTAWILAEQYIQQQRARRYIFDAFSRYLAPELVELIVRDSSKLKLGGERKNLTILFSDIRGFTEFSEKMEAPRLSQFLNQYLGLMTKMVFESHGTLDKYIGDAVMAFWGAPVAHRDHASRACRTALRMLEWTKANNQAIFNEYGIDLKIGIGVHTGEVSVGNMGSEQNMEYTAIGDNVNLCSRLEGVTKMYGVSIITTRQTFDAILESGQPLPAHRDLDAIRVKGKSNAVEIIELLSSPYGDAFDIPFQKGRQLYAAQKWDEAEEQFRAALKTRPVDMPSKLFIERCQHFKKQPPGVGWDGAWKMDTK